MVSIADLYYREQSRLRNAAAFVTASILSLVLSACGMAVIGYEE